MDTNKKSARRRIDSNQIILQIMALGGLAWYIIFYYLPYYGLTIAFREFKLVNNIFDAEWIGFKYFRELLPDRELYRAVVNTVSISVGKILICFTSAVLFALLLNEVPRLRFKKFVQTVTYFPHFISWIIVSLMIDYFFSTEFGMVNHLLMGLGLINKPITILIDPNAFYGLAVFTELWKSTGWSAIIFLAAIAGIDPTLYEVAVVDGASRWQKMFYITLPSIMGAVILVFLLNVSGIFSGVGGIFEQSMFLGNALNHNRSNTLGVYTMKTGISLGRFSYATAVGLVNGTVSLTILLISNGLAKKFFGRGLYTGGDNA